jgi:ADP-ribosyl-[dinitrogen reductase] hydrolase
LIRTSTTHPLEIATLPAGPGLGRIGVTFCPGKKQASAFNGRWERDLATDLAAIRQWGAAAVVTLLEPHELVSLDMADLGARVWAAHMDWLHLPIADVSAPCASFERDWQAAGQGLRTRLRHGFDVLIHCKGGLGRAGTIAARLLAELGGGKPKFMWAHACSCFVPIPGSR